MNLKAAYPRVVTARYFILSARYLE